MFNKEQLKALKKQIKFYEKELIDICPHENISPSFDKYGNDYHFTCSDCGMVFVTEDPNFVKNRKQ